MNLARIVTRVILASSVIALALVGAVGTATAMSTVHCAGAPSSKTGTGPYFSSGTMQIDPIASRGSEVSMHEHHFFGFTEWQNLAEPYNASYADLVGKKTSCNVITDSAAYWTPTLRFKSTKELVPILRSEAYYRAWDGKLTDRYKTTMPFPSDLRMIAGYPSAMSATEIDTSIVAWSCGNTSTRSMREGFYLPTPEAADCSTARPLPIPQGRVTLTVMTRFPTCWDGAMNDHTIAGNTADFVGDPSTTVTQHVAYPIAGSCPAGFPFRLPELKYITSWIYTGNGTDIEVSSGMGEALGKGFTWHTDFFNAWPKADLSRMVWTCINTNKTDDQVHQLYRNICGVPILMKP